MLKQIAKGATILSVGSILTKILSLIYVPILARSLGAEGLGLFNLAFALTPWFIVLGSLSMETVLTKFIAGNKDDAEKTSGIIQFGVGISLGLGFVLSLAFFLLAPAIAILVFNNPGLTLYLQLASPFIFLTITYNSLLGIFRGLENFKLFAAMDVTKQFFVVMLGSFFLLVLGLNVFGAILALVLSFIPIIIYSLFQLLPYFKKTAISAAEKMSLLVFGGFQMVFDLVASVPPTLDEIFLGIFTIPAIVGLYGSALTLATYATFFIIPLRKTLFPFVSEAFGKNDLAGVKRLTEETMKYALIVVGVSSIGFSIFSIELIRLFFGSSFLPALPLLIDLLLVIMLMSLVQVLNVSLVAANRTNDMTMIQLVALVVGGIGGFFILVPTWGALGAVAMMAVMYLIIFTGYVILCIKHLKVSFAAAVKLLALYSLVFILTLFVPFDLVWKIVSAFILEGIFLISLLVFRIVNMKELNKLFQLFWNPLKRMLNQSGKIKN